MKKLFLILTFTIFGMFTRIDSVFAVDYHFFVTTTNQTSSSWDFKFTIAAAGTFYVDCGTNGTLSRVNGSAATISGTTITRTDTTNFTQFKCHYTSSGSKTIQFGGLATLYPSFVAISFSPSPTLVKSISGDLSAIFPYISSSSGYYPDFTSTFAGCTNLTGTVPFTLFSGYIANGSPTISMYNMFNNTGLSTTCPSNKVQYKTGYESQWNDKVACGDPITCVSGKYLLAGSTTCNASCPSGYTCPAGTVGFNAKADENKYAPISLTWDGNSTTPSSCNVGGTFVPPTPSRPGYIFAGWRVSCASKIKNLDTSINGSVRAYTRLNGNVGYNESNYGLTVGSGQWAIEFPYGTVWGMANCNNTSGTGWSIDTPTLASSGTKCWCQATGFTASGNSYTSGPQCTITASSSWVNYALYTSDSSNCAEQCVYYCSNNVYTNERWRQILFGVAGQ